MWIVNQKGDCVKNIDTISDIYITEGNAIRCVHPYTENYVETLGSYRSEERAKEVFEEIINLYTKNEALKGADSLESIAINTFKEVYRMPKE